MSSAPIQFSVMRTDVDRFRVVVQSDRTILRTHETTFAGARAQIIQELLALEVGVTAWGEGKGGK